jgi:hypothetical protein
VNRNRKIWASAALAAVVAAVSVPASAQSLALTYKLDARSSAAEHAPVAMNQCAGFNWMTSIGVCGRELLARVAPVHAAEGVYTRSNAFDPTEVAAALDLPSLGGYAPEPRVRSASGRETLIGSTRSADFLLRLGSKYRFKASEDSGWDVYKFTDMKYETHVQNNGHKAVGVELHVPFQ